MPNCFGVKWLSPILRLMNFIKNKHFLIFKGEVVRFPTHGFFIMKTQTIKIPVYHGYIHVSLVKDAGFNCSAYTERDKNERCTYWLVIKKSKLSHALIAHELFTW